MPETTESNRQLLTQVALVHALGIDCDQDFNEITTSLARLTDCFGAFIAFPDGKQLWFKASNLGPTPVIELGQSFCKYTLHSGTPIVLDDVGNSALRENPFVKGEPFIRFYAGVPLRVRNKVVGTLCVIDQVPRDDSASVVSKLLRFGKLAEALVDGRVAAFATDSS